MKMLPRSRKKRIEKKWFIRTGFVRCYRVDKQDGKYWYKLPQFIKKLLWGDGK